VSLPAAHSHGDILHRISEALALGKMVLLPTCSVPLVKEFAMTTLRTRMMEDMQVRNLSRHTQDAYLLQISQFARHFAKSPALLGPEDIRAYQVYLTNEKKLAPRSVHVTVAALRFLYRVTLGLDWDFDQIIPCPKAPKTLAVILSPEEVLHFLGCIKSLKHTLCRRPAHFRGDPAEA
jgi:site-specific recombinase XerD